MERKKILIIDNDPDLLTSIADALKGKCYNVVIALDGDEGLRKVEEERPDLIILDVMTPSKHALKVCQDLRCQDRYRSFCRTPILLLTCCPQRLFCLELLSRVEELLKK